MNVCPLKPGSAPASQPSPWQWRIFGLIGVTLGSFFIEAKENDLSSPDANECPQQDTSRQMPENRISPKAADPRKAVYQVLLSEASTSQTIVTTSTPDETPLAVRQLKEKRYAEALSVIPLESLQIDARELDVDEDVRRTIENLIANVERYQEDPGDVAALCNLMETTGYLEENEDLQRGTIGLMIQASDGMWTYDFSHEICKKTD